MIMKKEIICTVCPRGCHIEVTGDGETAQNVLNYGCKRGLEYAQNEYSHPVRILTTTVKIDGIENDLLPVRSEKPIPKEKLFECMEVIKNTKAALPVKSRSVIVKNICGTGVDIIATAAR